MEFDRASDGYFIYFLYFLSFSHHLGMKGNLTERVVAVVLSLVITVPAVFGNLYLLIWQTYVLRVEVILNAIQLAFMGLEILFGIISCITFARFVMDALNHICLHVHLCFCIMFA